VADNETSTQLPSPAAVTGRRRAQAKRKASARKPPARRKSGGAGRADGHSSI